MEKATRPASTYPKPRGSAGITRKKRSSQSPKSTEIEIASRPMGLSRTADTHQSCGNSAPNANTEKFQSPFNAKFQAQNTSITKEPTIMSFSSRRTRQPSATSSTFTIARPE